MVDWDEARLLRMIADQEPEGLRLEYKSAGAIGTQNDQRDAITKEVSAMANSAGGVVIFGVACFRDKKYIPEKLDPIDASRFSQEWLGQKISLISPRIDGYEIHPVEISPSGSGIAYVVEIPQSSTAHQATDHIYYKRFDARSVPMEDYEIRDVMGRRQHPKIEVSFMLYPLMHDSPLPSEMWKLNPVLVTSYRLAVAATNIGNVYAQYVSIFLFLPRNLVANPQHLLRATSENGIDYVQYQFANHQPNTETFGPYLPGITRPLTMINLATVFNPRDFGDYQIDWTSHADSAPPNRGIILFKNVQTAP